MAIPTTPPPTQEINLGWITTKVEYGRPTEWRKATEDDRKNMIAAEKQRKINSEARLKELTELEATNKKALSGGDLIELIILRGARKIQR